MRLRIILIFPKTMENMCLSPFYKHTFSLSILFRIYPLSFFIMFLPLDTNLCSVLY